MKLDTKRTFLIGLAFLSICALAFVTMTQVRHGDVRPSAKKSALESPDTDD